MLFADLLSLHLVTFLMLLYSHFISNDLENLITSRNVKQAVDSTVHDDAEEVGN